MSTRFSFQLGSSNQRQDLPHKLLLAQDYTETPTDILLKLLGYLLFFRERLQVETNLHNDDIPFVPDLVQLDYEMQPALWIECGETNVTKLNRLAVKAPLAELWVLQPSVEAAEALIGAMIKAKLRGDRYRVIGFEAGMIEELLTLMKPRNEVFWVGGSIQASSLQLEFNELWFDSEFTLFEF